MKQDNTTVHTYFDVTVPSRLISKNKYDPNTSIGIVAVRVDRPKKDDPSAHYKVSFAFCSPESNFCKAEARNYCDSRIKNKIQGISPILVTLQEKKPLKNVVEVAIQKLLQGEGGYKLPLWVKNSILQYSDGTSNLDMVPRQQRLYETREERMKTANAKRVVKNKMRFDQMAQNLK